jgi:hypothetical protein
MGPRQPEVGFGDIAADLREDRLWIVSGLPTTPSAGLPAVEEITLRRIDCMRPGIHSSYLIR